MVRYCDMGRSPAELLADWAYGWGNPEIFQGASRGLVFTQSGRAAIALAARHWDIGPNDEVLVPAYNCGSEISPLIATGAKVSMYRINSQARIDVGDVFQRITPRTRLIHVTHYFGWPEDLSKLVSYCRQEDIKVLEDCALSLFSRDTGHSGDAAIFSLRKSLAVCDGGVLSLRNADQPTEIPLAQSINLETVRGLLSLQRKWARRFTHLLPSIEQERCCETSMVADNFPPLPTSYYWTRASRIAEPSRCSLGQLRRIDWQEIVRRRRENYAQLRHSFCDAGGFRFLWEDDALPDGMCPLGLPILVDDRPHWYRTLNGAGIVVSPWWEGYHAGLNWAEFPEARALKSKLLLLPVHQGLSPTDIDYIARVVRACVNKPSQRRPRQAGWSNQLAGIKKQGLLEPGEAPEH